MKACSHEYNMSRLIVFSHSLFIICSPLSLFLSAHTYSPPAVAYPPASPNACHFRFASASINSSAPIQIWLVYSYACIVHSYITEDLQADRVSIPMILQLK